MPAAFESARRQWAEGDRRVRATRDPREAERLHAVVGVVGDELRRRLGGEFTLAELAELYDGADRWLYEAVAERAPGEGWERLLSTAGDAAFHLYARGARDYAP